MRVLILAALAVILASPPVSAACIMSYCKGQATASTRNVPRHLAAYALNSTASSILLLAAEVGLEY